MVVPVFKLFTLALKSLSKPVSKNLYLFAKDHPRFSRGCIALGRGYHRFSARLQGRRVVGPVCDDVALTMGSEAAVELSAYLVAAAMLTVEFTWSSAKEQAKREKQEARFDDLRGQLEKLNALNADLLVTLRGLKAQRHPLPPAAPT
jgi:hypothetical protein|eukprot:TRINITY_DN12021_c0_g1_i1.p1 TRINITY_DN12021_c0_g1~~TRINITY_DN12021_c0_g1_i1.p1  ORF type:complete len:155 (+),score=50.30 TRINITY_DN12021_c0_g1_i1:27-467(+)